MSIVLTQHLNPTTDEWQDIRVPRKPGPPRRGSTVIETPQEFADALVKAGLPGIYRAVHTNGDVFRITVTREDRYVATVEQELPPA